MREIKFRAWIKSSKAMANWDIIRRECDRLSIFTDDNFIFMQYTGLKDKNGKEIYEGDVVNDFMEQEIYIVKFIENGFWMTDKEDKERVWLSNGTFEIIGNKYENPELIKT